MLVEDAVEKKQKMFWQQRENYSNALDVPEIPLMLCRVASYWEAYSWNQNSLYGEFRVTQIPGGHRLKPRRKIIYIYVDQVFSGPPLPFCASSLYPYFLILISLDLY